MRIDHPQIEFRKKHLAKYLEALVTKPYDASTVRYLDGVASIHTREKGSADIHVPLVHVNALFGFVAGALIETIASFGLDPKVETEAQAAFMKLLWIQNDLFLRNYGN